MSQHARILLSLIVGLVIGIAAANAGGGWVNAAIDIAQPVGEAWLAGLKMTIIPLVVSLLVTGVAATAETARSGRVAARALALFMTFLVASATLAAVLMPALLALWPLDPTAAGALKRALAEVKPVGDVPGFAAFMKSIVPSNPVAAAANGEMLPLIVFTMVFAFAITRLNPARRDTLVALFQALADAMLVIINWVLAIAPIGVAALAFVVGARAGTAAVGALVHYIALYSAVGFVIMLIAYPVAVLGGRVPLGRFARAVAPAQAVAISTQSSLASLPAMLTGAEAAGLPVRIAGVVLPLAVAVFRVTAPAMNLAVTLYIANWYGIALSPFQLAAGVIAASLTTFNGVGLPGQVTFIASIAPICLAIGVPIEALGLLIAVETIPDIFRTLGNVTMDVAVTATVARGERALEP
ncbi:dicarboxylate/amino acid:cation symporter [Sphingomonas sp.]|uniref:dicarboxylate/amino acid:cation symporter n=1 Tax=Sphingomonas sp. TaxID=28214 RepID=UPI001D33A628|nr:dicarboxylate/amino acid:cation symporter [Sphingomonas sp.]MBX9796779.1 dicarboxylate/amino acid:cation symporter [Sphingomonas sp.]